MATTVSSGSRISVKLWELPFGSEKWKKYPQNHLAGLLVTDISHFIEILTEIHVDNDACQFLSTAPRIRSKKKIKVKNPIFHLWTVVSDGYDLTKNIF